MVHDLPWPLRCTFMVVMVRSDQRTGTYLAIFDKYRSDKVFSLAYTSSRWDRSLIYETRVSPNPLPAWYVLLWRV